MTSASQQAQPQAQSVHTPSASAPSDSSSSPDELSWEGDKMFNIYIWDYCVKRGYSNTARELAEEAKLNPNPRPPIDAKQGLLYEWWSVFWLLFSAKSNNQGNDDALVYIQHHLAQQSRMHQIPGMQRYPNGLRALPGAHGTIGIVPNSLGAGAPPHPGHSNQPPNAHSMPNGVGPAGPGQQQAGHPQGLPQQHAQGQHPPQAPPPLGFPAHVQQQQPQPNGVPAHGRPPLPGQPGRPFYQSPTIQHQQPGGTSGPPPPYPGPGPVSGGVPPNMYPSHMRPMLPPGAPNGIGGGVAGSPGFSHGNVGTGSRAPTPAQPTSSITQPSPSMSHRSVPASTPPSFGPSGMNLPGGRGPPFDQVNAEIQRIDSTSMNELRQELGLGNKDLAAMSIDEKNRLVSAFRQRNTPGPSNPARPPQGRGAKRNSVSPGDEHAEIPAKDEASPPAQKRVRRSPEQAAPPAQGPTGPVPPNANPNPAGGMYPPNMVPNGMRPGAPFPPQMVGMPSTPSMMMPPGSHQGPTNQQLSQFQKSQSQAYHANLQAATKMGPAGMPTSPSVPVSNTGDTVSDTSPDPQQQQQMQQPQFGGDPSQGRSFGVGQRPTMNQNKMPPPSSPATNAGPGKPGQNAQSKVEGGKIDTSPRNGPPPSTAGSTGRSPPTPAPGPGTTSTPSPSRPTTSTSNPPSGPTSSQTPVQQQVPPPPASAPPTAPAETMSFDFMTTGFDDFTSMFGRDEAGFDDFGITSWFSGDMTMPDLK